MPWHGPPEDELGVGVPLQARIASGPDAVVVLNGCVAFTTGFQLWVGIRRREEPPPIPDPRARRGPYEPVEMSLALGVRFVDGRSTSGSGRGLGHEASSYWKAWSEGKEPAVPVGPIVGASGGGGGGRRWDMHYWVWPLPPDGPMTITCEWPLGGIASGEVVVDGTRIRQAGEVSEKLW